LDGKRVFCYIGGFQKWQGVENFITAASKIEHSSLGFLLVRGKDSWHYKNIIKIPTVPRKIIRMYYAICDIFVLPRPYHLATIVAGPTKLAEYTAMGKPILATKVGDAPLLIRKYNCGYIVKSNHPQDLLMGIKWFANLTDSELREMGVNARKLAEEEFDWKKIAISLYNNLKHIINV